MINDKWLRRQFPSMERGAEARHLSFIVFVLSLLVFHFSFSPAGAQTFTFVELNCENLFDCQHDEGKEDQEFTPDGTRRWSRSRYWRKLNHGGQELLSCSERLPDLVALVEVENDTVLRDLTRRSLLRGAGYEYLMTCSPDVRGLDVALLYQPATFRPFCYDYISVPPLKEMRPTRDILYVQGETLAGDTLHVFVVHAPSRYGGELETRAHRQQVMSVLCPAIRQLAGQQVIVAGDFNDYEESPSLLLLAGEGLVNVSAHAQGRQGRAKGTYRYRGEWHSLDHILLSRSLSTVVDSIYVNDAPFLLEAEPTYGGWRPRRAFQGFRYQREGFSDHLPLVLRLRRLRE